MLGDSLEPGVLLGPTAFTTARVTSTTDATTASMRDTETKAGITVTRANIDTVTASLDAHREVRCCHPPTSQANCANIENRPIRSDIS